MTFYYNKMMALWQELDLCYDKKWEYTNDNMKQMENDRVCAFLVGLNKDLYKSRKSLPSIWEVFSVVQSEEAQWNVMLNGKPHLNTNVWNYVVVSKGLEQDGDWRNTKKPWCNHWKKRLGTLMRLIGNFMRSLKTRKRSEVEMVNLSSYLILIKGNKMLWKCLLSPRIN